MRNQRKNDLQREHWVMKTEPLYEAFKKSGYDLRQYVRRNRMQLDTYIKRIFHGSDQAHRTAA